MEGIPKTADMHLPVLEIIADGGVHKIARVTDLIAERMGVAAEAAIPKVLTGSHDAYST